MPILKITAVPPGEAPEWVREKWVGLALPLQDEFEKPAEAATVGVLSIPKTWFGWLVWRWRQPQVETGYFVEVMPAIEILAQSSPTAADWWRTHVPQLCQPGQFFLFAEHIGEVSTSDPLP